MDIQRDNPDFQTDDSVDAAILRLMPDLILPKVIVARLLLRDYKAAQAELSRRWQYAGGAESWDLLCFALERSGISAQEFCRFLQEIGGLPGDL